MEHQRFNRMSKELGYNSYEALSEFLSSELYQDMVFMIAERFDWGKAALHLHCGWDLRHLVAIPSNCASCGHVLRRFDGL
eukprot:scaffold531433_cov48-Prasinocladus_malaysianus.AAC.1